MTDGEEPMHTNDISCPHGSPCIQCNPRRKRLRLAEKGKRRTPE